MLSLAQRASRRHESTCGLPMAVAFAEWRNSPVAARDEQVEPQRIRHHSSQQRHGSVTTYSPCPLRGDLVKVIERLP